MQARARARVAIVVHRAYKRFASAVHQEGVSGFDDHPLGAGNLLQLRVFNSLVGRHVRGSTMSWYIKQDATRNQTAAKGGNVCESCAVGVDLLGRVSAVPHAMLVPHM